VTEPGLVSDDRSRPWRGVAVEVIWNEIPLVSRILLALTIGLIPAGYVTGAYYITPQGCVSETQQVYAAIFGILVCYSAYVWVIDRPRVWRAVRTAIASKRIQIRKAGWSYEVDQGTQNVRFGVGSLALMTIGSLMILAWCFWDPVIIRACAGQLRGGPNIALIMPGTTFLILVMHQTVFWWSMVLSAVRAPA